MGGGWALWLPGPRRPLPVPPSSGSCCPTCTSPRCPPGIPGKPPAAARLRGKRSRVPGGGVSCQVGSKPQWPRAGNPETGQPGGGTWHASQHWRAAASHKCDQAAVSCHAEAVPAGLCCGPWRGRSRGKGGAGGGGWHPAHGRPACPGRGQSDQVTSCPLH